MAIDSVPGRQGNAQWPPLPWAEWQDTCTTLHMWLQIVGKVKLALAPFLNEWWQVTFFVSARGLTSGVVPYRHGVFDAEFDFFEHNLHLRTSNGGHKALPLVARSVSRFYAEVMAALNALGIEVAINTLPVEVANPIRCEENEVNASYDAEYVGRWWRILVEVDSVLRQFRTPFVGKSSPIQFFWGSFDLSHSRFSGRPAAPPAGAPRFLRLAEDQQNFTCGFWPGNPSMTGQALGQPAFFAYVYPEPPGFKESAIRPDHAFYHPGFGQFILPYDQLRQATSPDQALLDFFQSTYESAATLAGWDRANLEREYSL